MRKARAVTHLFGPLQRPNCSRHNDVKLPHVETLYSLAFVRALTLSLSLAYSTRPAQPNQKGEKLREKEDERKRKREGERKIACLLDVVPRMIALGRTLIFQEDALPKPYSCEEGM